jgi:hypothetical protein
MPAGSSHHRSVFSGDGPEEAPDDLAEPFRGRGLAGGFADVEAAAFDDLGGVADVRADGWLRRTAAVCRAFAEAPCCV